MKETGTVDAKTRLSNTLKCFATLCFTTRQYEEAKDYYIRCIAIREQVVQITNTSSAKERLYKVYMEYSKFLRKLDDEKTAQEYEEKAKQISNENKKE